MDFIWVHWQAGDTYFRWKTSRNVNFKQHGTIHSRVSFFIRRLSQALVFYLPRHSTTRRSTFSERTRVIVARRALKWQCIFAFFVLALAPPFFTWGISMQNSGWSMQTNKPRFSVRQGETCLPFTPGMSFILLWGNNLSSTPLEITGPMHDDLSHFN